MVKCRYVLILECVALITTLFTLDASAQSWQYIAPMLHPRDDAKCVELLDGRILMVGGEDASNALSECEIYNPATNSWSVTGSLNQERHRLVLTRLNDGRVLAVGGLTDRNVATTASCEIYDPKSGTWKVTASLDIPSENIAGITLPNGKVFVAGGLDANSPVQYLDFAEIFDPSTETFTRLPEMGVARTGLLLFIIHSLTN